MATKKSAKNTNETKKHTRPTFDATEQGKKDRFAFYATLRMNRTLKLLSQLKNLANATIYTSTEEQRRKIVDTLSDGVKEVEARFFSVSGDGKSSSFRF